MALMRRHDLEVAILAGYMSRVAVIKSQGDLVQKVLPAIAAAIPAITGALSSAGGAVAGSVGALATGAGAMASRGAAGVGKLAQQGAKAAIADPKAAANTLNTVASSTQNSIAQAQQKKDQQLQGAKDAATRHASIETQKGFDMAFEYSWVFLKGVGAQTTLPSFDPQQVSEAVEGDQGGRKVYISSKPGDNDNMPQDEQQERHNNLLQDLSNLGGGSRIFSGKGHSPWGEEHSFMLDNVQEEDMMYIQAIAAQYGQEAIAVTGDEEGPRFETPQGDVTDRFGQENLAGVDDDPQFFTQFQTGQKSVLS